MIQRGHLLNISRRPQTSEKIKKKKPPSDSIGQKKKRRERNESGCDLNLREGAMKEEKFLHPGKFPH